MLIIDPKSIASAVQDPRHKLDRYAFMELTPEQKELLKKHREHRKANQPEGK